MLCSESVCVTEGTGERGRQSEFLNGSKLWKKDAKLQECVLHVAHTRSKYQVYSHTHTQQSPISDSNTG